MGFNTTFPPAFLRRGRTAAKWSLLLAIAFLVMTATAVDSDWRVFKQQFVDQQGRVIDAGQGNASHSEGQGFAMLLAVHHDDRTSFDHLWTWTQQHLQVRDDSLLAWRWDPQLGVVDKNNASDADLFVAWALLRANDKWHSPDYLAASQKIAQDIRKKLLRKAPQGLVLLPGLEGFDKPEGLTINLSYWVLPALREIGRADPAPEWDELAKTGIAMLQYSRFGRWGLPPDWLKLEDKVSPADGFPERFSYDAVRIPLYLLWSRQESDALLKPYREFWAYFAGARFLPAWTNLKDDSVDSYDAPAGIRGIALWVGDYPNGQATRLPALDERQTYYSAALLLLCKMAQRERNTR